MINLDQRIKVCPECRGWGKLANKEDQPCDRCLGEGVYIQEGDKRKGFGMPFFVDFGSRQKAKIIKILSIVFILIVIAIILLIVVFT
jgi:hypothetical protein